MRLLECFNRWEAEVRWLAAAMPATIAFKPKLGADTKAKLPMGFCRTSPELVCRSGSKTCRSGPWP